MASDTEYGLSLGILGDVGLAMQLADAIPSGIIHINEQTVADEANIPSGSPYAARSRRTPSSHGSREAAGSCGQRPVCRGGCR